MKKRSGFTLVELLVTICVIGILASIMMGSYTKGQKQARDTQRKSDLSQYRNALENYAATNAGLYLIRQPAAVYTSTFCSSFLLPNFISSCPDDPFTTLHYNYLSDAGGLKYVVYADLETAGYFYLCSTGTSGVLAGAPVIANCP